jgi:signal transduction histidine kinase
MLVNRRIIRPVGELTAVVVGAIAGDRATVAGPRELAHLAAEFNAMLQRREETENRLQEALALLARSREDERRVIATILHDDALQTLTSAMWQLDGVESGDDLDRRRRGISATRSALEATLASMRNLMLELRPPALDELGLSAAVAELLEGLRVETGAEIELDDGLADRLPEQVETLAFRTIQEALRNVRKHARASRVTVRVGTDGHRLEVSVGDDGVGIEPGELGRRAAAGHLGVRSMREFVVIAGGEFSIRPGPERGTEVSFSLPLSVSVPA